MADAPHKSIRDLTFNDIQEREEKKVQKYENERDLKIGERQARRQMASRQSPKKRFYRRSP